MKEIQKKLKQKINKLTKKIKKTKKWQISIDMFYYYLRKIFYN